MAILFHWCSARRVFDYAILLWIYFYLENFASYNKLYGSIGTIIALMLWLYLTSVIVLVCFEVNVSFDLAEEKQRNRDNLKKLLANSKEQ